VRLVAVTPFLNEEEHLGELLASMAAQRRRPDCLVLVDDGSTDGSPALADAFAATHPFATVVHRAPRPPERDRMVRAHELKAFELGLGHAGDWDVAVKLDADLRLPESFFAEAERWFREDPGLGVAGAYLSSPGADGALHRQPCPAGHVEGENTFYRRACWEQISPLPAMLGWDTIDEVRARMRGWRTRSFAIPGGDPVHLRRMGSYDGVLRGYRRAGLAAWAYGSHPLHVALSAAARTAKPPRPLCGAHYAWGWAAAGLRRHPRAEPEARRWVHREQFRRLPPKLGGPA
jgi:glycosyltransferase involved in cell wall biosynthesis